MTSRGVGPLIGRDRDKSIELAAGQRRGVCVSSNENGSLEYLRTKRHDDNRRGKGDDPLGNALSRVVTSPRQTRDRLYLHTWRSF